MEPGGDDGPTEGGAVESNKGDDTTVDPTEGDRVPGCQGPDIPTPDLRTLAPSVSAIARVHPSSVSPPVQPVV